MFFTHLETVLTSNSTRVPQYSFKGTMKWQCFFKRLAALCWISSLCFNADRQHRFTAFWNCANSVAYFSFLEKTVGYYAEWSWHQFVWWRLCAFPMLPMTHMPGGKNKSPTSHHRKWREKARLGEHVWLFFLKVTCELSSAAFQKSHSAAWSMQAYPVLHAAGLKPKLEI